MLYQLHEMQRAVLNPMTKWAEAGAKMYSNPFSPLAHMPVSRRVAAGFELLYRLGKEYEKPEFGIKTVRCGDREIAISEEIVDTKPFCKLIHFRKLVPKEAVIEDVTPVLVQQIADVLDIYPDLRLVAIEEARQMHRM